MKAFLGLLNNYGAFFPKLKYRVTATSSVIEKQEPWNWTADCEESLNNSTKIITVIKLLIFYDKAKPVRLSCDSSSYGVGAVISHILKDASERPVFFASRTLSETERRFA